MVRKLGQRLVDLDAEASGRRPPRTLQAHRLFTTIPLYQNGGADLWSSGVFGWVTPIELLGRDMHVTSVRAYLRALSGEGNVSYSIAIYEGLSFVQGALTTPTAGAIQARLLAQTLVIGSVARVIDSNTNYVVLHSLAEEAYLDHRKQYFVWLSIDVGGTTVHVLTPSRAIFSYAVDNPTFIPPPMIELSRKNSGSQRPAPLVELRSRYGAFIFGDTSTG
ncbi:hypothetical protein [Bacteriophage sp.]|nr:hypothetical protein [Bacteriophage sp.]UOF80123.1 hypothetical protein [Bacteriophage sp.]